MARHPSLLSSCTPNKVSAAEVTIGHVQLRDLVICPQEPGVLNYVQNSSIVEHDLYAPDSSPRTIADLTFTPNTLTSLHVPGTDKTLLAAGGQDAEIHLSLHNRSSRCERRDDHSSRLRCNYHIWKYFIKLSGSINNSVLLSSLSLTRSNESSVEPRLAVSNNDWKVKFYDIPIREDSAPKEMRPCGLLKLEEPVNHSSISPDGRTLLSVGDSPRIYLHQLTGGARITFNPIVTLNVPPPDTRLYSASLAASFSTAFSADGMKFAVASQEGVVAVWDVRSTKPMKVIQTDKTRSPTGQHGNGESSSWLSDDPNDWTRGGSRAPGWGARNVKFGSGGTNGRPGKELMTFTEHTNLLHVFDARTFEQEETVRVPGVSRRKTVSPRSLFSPSAYLDPRPQRRPMPSPHMTRAVDEFFGGVFPDNDPIPSWRPPRRELRRGDGMEDEHDHGVLPVIRGRHNTRTHIMERISPPGGWRVDGHELRYGDGDVAPEDVEMDVDEMEGDCISSRGPSRSSSPPPSIHLPVQPSPSPTRSTTGGRHTSSRPSSHPRRRTITREDAIFDLTPTQDYDYDIAGTCFDPDGGFIYVAATDSVSEWAVRGANKRWWGGSEWI
ncbi:WD40-repeat-containing domain protein [Pisolithus tinctorius]|uniref:Uncharacterized protein n=1 Tax=Pisolithus tinctorius Marx 270 TaxID=870435 RepID=A0A0C3K0Z8_PISTI|nr:WD40-repeat-containing domain protein [Pisolithus tinctorius]KIO15093.1 hypothetical protein M404DRAFT_991792 [Pisolithus tinctorius Marx 270]